LLDLQTHADQQEPALPAARCGGSAGIRMSENGIGCAAAHGIVQVGHGDVLRALCCWLPRSVVCGKRFDGFAEF
jgi:hypothetical protein